MTMQVIQHIELTGTQATIEFTSIPQDATDLLCVVSARTNGTIFAAVVDDVTILFNGSSANFSYRNLFGKGNAIESNTSIHNFVNGVNATSSTFGNLAIYIPNYTSSANKSFSVDSVTENNATDARQLITAGLWSNTAAITAIRFDPAYGDFVAGSSATLYKITKGSDGTTTVS